MKNKTTLILLISMICLFTSCSKPTGIFGEYEFADLIRVVSISSLSYDCMKEQKAGTQYIIDEDSLTITNDEEKTELLNIAYEKEELTDKLIEENYVAEDTALMELFDSYKKRYRYSIFDENGDKLSYYIFLMDGDVFMCHYARADSLIHWIDKIIKAEEDE